MDRAILSFAHSPRRLFDYGLFIIAAALGVLIAGSVLAEDAKQADAAKPGELPTIRIRAGSTQKYKDKSGNEWLPDVEAKEGGFEGGDLADRADDMKIDNTKDPELYRHEHWGMESFSWKLPNGKYVVRLHFAETWDGINGPGDRVFTFTVQNKEFKDFDVWLRAGGHQRAYIETVPATVTDGKLKLTFTPQADNPEINAIEIIPADKAATMEKDAGKK